jgi:hypothetical protein
MLSRAFHLKQFCFGMFKPSFLIKINLHTFSRGEQLLEKGEAKVWSETIQQLRWI